MQSIETASVKKPRLYEVFFGNRLSLEQNADLMGMGSLKIDESTDEVLFSGKRRALLSSRTTEFSFRRKEISGIKINGAAIRFDTIKGRSGRQGNGFYFSLPTSLSAAEVGSILQARESRIPPPFEEKGGAPKIAANSFATSVTGILVLLNIAVFVGMAAFLDAGWIETTNNLPYVRYGANNGAATTGGEWWRLITSMFMHYGIVHLLFNLWALVKIGSTLEYLFGKMLFALIYIGAGACAGLTSILIHRDQVWSAGASGAIFGLYGALLGYFCRERSGSTKSVIQPIVKSALFFVAYNILYGLGKPNIDLACHCGGFASGLIFGFIAAYPQNAENVTQIVSQRIWQTSISIAVLVSVGVLITPRFDYNVSEELLLQDTSNPFSAEEAKLLDDYRVANRTNVVLSMNAKEAQESILKLQYLYTRWTHALESLKLNPDLKSAKRRTDIPAAI